MTQPDADRASDAACWKQIGVWGDRSCPELASVIHCRNCGVYSAGGRRLLDRSSPDDYLDNWTDLLATQNAERSDATTPHVVFRVGQSWLGIRATALRELTPPAVIRSIPHQRSDVLLGLTAVRGEILPCISLHALMGEAVTVAADQSPRFLVARHQGADWVIPVDEVSGMFEVATGAVEPLPTTLTRASGVYTVGIAQCGDRSVGLVDEELIFGALARRMS